MKFSKTFAIATALAGAMLIASNASRADTPPQVRDLVIGRPVAQALVLLTTYRTPLLGGMFSSSDPRRCVRLELARTDASGRWPAGVAGRPGAVIADGVAGIAELTEQPAEGGGFVLVAQRLQSSAASERFGPEYSSEADAVAAREAFLRTSDGANHTAFTVKPYGAAGFQNFRMLQVKYVEVARGQQRYLTAAEADAALRGTVWTLAGRPDAQPWWDVLRRCQDAKLDNASLLPAVLDALQAASPEAARTPLQRDVLRAWRKRVGR